MGNCESGAGCFSSVDFVFQSGSLFWRYLRGLGIRPGLPPRHMLLPLLLLLGPVGTARQTITVVTEHYTAADTFIKTANLAASTRRMSTSYACLAGHSKLCFLVL